MSGYSIPQASDDSIKKVVIGYYRADSSGGELSHEKAAEGADVSTDVARRQRPFLKEIGIVEKSDSGHTVTEAGREIGRNLQYDREEDAKRPFASLLRKWEATPKILEDIGPDYVSKDEVIQSIAYVTERDVETTRQVAGANGLVDLYEWTGILETNGDGEYRVGDMEPDESRFKAPETSDDSDGEKPEKPAPEQPPQNSPNGGTVPQTPQNPPSFTGAPFDISLELTGDEDPKNVRKLVVAVRKGLELEIDDEDDDPETRSDGGKKPESNEDSSLDSFLDD